MCISAHGCASECVSVQDVQVYGLLDGSTYLCASQGCANGMLAGTLRLCQGGQVRCSHACMHVCVHAYVHTYTCTHIHTYTCADQSDVEPNHYAAAAHQLTYICNSNDHGAPCVHVCPRALLCVRARAVRVRAYFDACICMYEKFAYRAVCMCMHMRKCSHACMHVQVCAHMHHHARARTHTHAG